MGSVVTSTANPLVKKIRRLADHRHRAAEGAFFVEGIAPVWQAIDAGAPVETIVVADELLTSSAARRAILAQEGKVPFVWVTPRVFEAIAERENPSGLGAIVGIRPRALTELKVVSDALYVALVEPGNPGNVGAIIRTVDGLGASGVILIGAGTDPHHPRAVRSSMGSIFQVPYCRVEALQEAIRWGRANSMSIITTSARAKVDCSTADFELPALLVLGSEGTGLTAEDLDAGDIAVRIPMRGSATSLNLAVAAGILMYEITVR